MSWNLEAGICRIGFISFLSLSLPSEQRFVGFADGEKDVQQKSESREPGRDT
jgi:hypothetical protein